MLEWEDIKYDYDLSPEIYACKSINANVQIAVDVNELGFVQDRDGEPGFPWWSEGKPCNQARGGLGGA